MLELFPERLNKTPAQILLRWVLQHCGSAVLGSSNPDHLKENREALAFELSEDGEVERREFNQKKGGNSRVM